MYKVLIVDDEFLARKLLQGHLQHIADMEVVGTAQNAQEAINFLREQTVDIVLLDIHMPDLSGMELAHTLSEPKPAIIFTTAYSDYAVESYEVSAVDYLLKPIDLPRLEKALEKARASIGRQEGASLMVKADYRTYKIMLDDLLFIEGQHEYVSFYTTQRRITALYSLKSLEEELPADRFIRIHKSYIVCKQRISEYDGNTVVVADQRIPVGGVYRDAFLKKMTRVQ